MHDYHLTFANVTLFLMAGSLFVAGSACMLSSQFGVLTGHRRARGRQE